MNIVRLARSALLCCALVFPGTTLAQYTGPGANPMPGNIAEILKNPVDDQNVLLRGNLLKKISSDKYLFSDGSGEIRVEIDDDLFRNIKVTETTVIEIHGEIEKDFLQDPEIDVRRISMIKP